MSRRRRGAAGPVSGGWLARLGFSWWMPALALLAPAGYGVFRAFVGDEGALEEFGRALVWPGALIYIIALAAVWAGWALQLE